jgi:hypothetical protein
MSRLGNYLEKQGLLTREQLEAALQHQAEHGARLGTNLVELGMLRVEQLAESLSMFHNVALPPRKWIERPHRAAVKRVSRLLVERVRFIPMRLDGNVLHVAVMDPRHPRVLDDLRFATGCRIEPYVLPEIWMHDWLLTLFKMPRGIREIATAAPWPVHPPAAGQSYDFEAAQVAQVAQMAQVAQAMQVMAPPVPAARAMPVHAPPPVPAAARPPLLIVQDRRSAPPNAAAQEWAVAPIAPGFAQQPVAAPFASANWPLHAPAPAPAPAATVRSLAELAAAAAIPTAQEAPPPSWQDPEPQSGSFWQRKPVFDWTVQAPEPRPSAREALPPEPRRVSERVPPPRSERPQARAHSAPVSERVPPPESERPAAMAHSARVATSELVHLETQLREVNERERLLELSMTIGASFASRVALFVVQRGAVQGLRCSIQGTARTIDGVRVPLESISMLADAASATEPARVDPRARTFDQHVLELLDDTSATEAVLFPVAVKQRVVNVLYASNGRDPLGAIAFAALAALAQQMGAAYEQLILHRKAAGSAR